MVPFEDGFVHDGVRQAAANKRRTALPHAIRALEEFPGYSLIITGHSLGAGTAAVLTAMVITIYIMCFVSL